MKQSALNLVLIAGIFLLGACGSHSPQRPEALQRGAQTLPSRSFMTHLSALCGKAFAGHITANEPPNPNDAFAGKALIMHVRECASDELRIPFHVGDDHSRTWVLRVTDQGLRLKHDHRHQDGSEDKVTQYGGDTQTAGKAERQEFPVDEFSRGLFERESMQVSMSNTWAMEIQPGQRFVYELSRPGRLFRVEFDLQQPVPTPPPPWGTSDRDSQE
jgi:hypothetical protein